MASKPKGRSSDGLRKRRVGTRSQAPSILIVCEGTRTEPNYFRAFPVMGLEVNVLGTGYNTDSLVQLAAKKRKDYDEVWCVFDRDSFPAANFTRALEVAAQHGISTAWSNESFEIWYLLHFHYYDSAISRSLYEDKLSELLPSRYRKNASTIYDELLPRQGVAVMNAEKLLASYEPSVPARDNPCTTVFRLVARLNQFLRP